MKAGVSYWGFMHNVYGEDRRAELFPELGHHWSALAYNRLLDAVMKGKVSIPEGLREEFSNCYLSYCPEAFGRRSKQGS